LIGWGGSMRMRWPEAVVEKGGPAKPEFKSTGHPYRARSLDRLWSYIHAYFADLDNGVARRTDLAGVLIIPNRTQALDTDILEMGLSWTDLGGGYGELTGGLFRLYIAEIDPIAEHEDDDLLRLFSHAQERTLEARRFWAEQVGTKEALMAVQDLVGYDEVVQRFLDQLSPEHRLAGLAPEQRLAGLSREQILLGLPDDELRRLPEEYLATFSPETQQAVRERLRRS
jgi:hypothetical protein